MIFTEGTVGGPANLVAWLRLWSLAQVPQVVKVTMIADDGRLAPGQRPRTRTKSFTVDPMSPFTVSVHDEMWGGESASFSTMVEFQDVGDAGIIVRPGDLQQIWDPGKVSNFGGKMVCQ